MWVVFLLFAVLVRYYGTSPEYENSFYFCFDDPEPIPVITPLVGINYISCDRQSRRVIRESVGELIEYMKRRRFQVFPKYAFTCGWNRYQRIIPAMMMATSPVTTSEIQGHKPDQDVDSHEDDSDDPDPAPSLETADSKEDVDDTDDK